MGFHANLWEGTCAKQLGFSCSPLLLESAEKSYRGD